MSEPGAYDGELQPQHYGVEEDDEPGREVSEAPAMAPGEGSAPPLIPAAKATNPGPPESDGEVELEEDEDDEAKADEEEAEPVALARASQSGKKARKRRNTDLPPGVPDEDEMAALKEASQEEAYQALLGRFEDVCARYTKAQADVDEAYILRYQTSLVASKSRRRLNEVVGEHEERFEAVTRKLDEAESERDEWKGKYEELAREMDATDVEVGDLVERVQVAAGGSTIERLRAVVAHLQRRQAQAEQLHRSHSELQQGHADAERTMEQLQAELRATKLQLNEVRAEKAAQDAAHRAERERIAQYLGQEEASRRKKKRRSKRRGAEADSGAGDGDILQQLAALRAELDEAEADAAKWKKQFKERDHEADVLTANMAHLRFRTDKEMKAVREMIATSSNLRQCRKKLIEFDQAREQGQ